MRVGQLRISLRAKAHTARQRVHGFARGLKRGLGRDAVQSAFRERDAWHAMPGLGSSLRTAFVAFCGKTNVLRGFSLSAGATRPTPLPPPY